MSVKVIIVIPVAEIATNNNDNKSDKIVSRPASQAYADGWENIFGKKSKEKVLN